MAKKKKKQSKSLESLLSLIGWIIILLGLAILFIATYLIDSDSFFNKFFNKYTISIFLFILGLGFFLIWPKELKDYENDEIPISLHAKFLVLPPFLEHCSSLHHYGFFLNCEERNKNILSAS